MKKTGFALGLTLLTLSASSHAVPFDFNGSADNTIGSYYYAVTGGKFPTGNVPNGDNASGGTFRFLTDEPAWGYPIQQWRKDDWFTENAGLALTLKAGGSIL